MAAMAVFWLHSCEMRLQGAQPHLKNWGCPSYLPLSSFLFYRGLTRDEHKKLTLETERLAYLLRHGIYNKEPHIISVWVDSCPDQGSALRERSPFLIDNTALEDTFVTVCNYLPAYFNQ